MWLWCTSACKSIQNQNTSRDWVIWANCPIEAEGGFWVETHSQRDPCRVCPARRHETLTLEKKH